MRPTLNSSRRGPGITKCFLFGWVAAWALATYLGATGLWLAGQSRVVGGPHGPAAIFAIADAASMQSKLAYGFVLGALLAALRKIAGIEGRPLQAADCAAAITAQLLVLALLPVEWSGGFGIGLTGTRFAAQPTLIYCLAAAIGATIAMPLERSCRRNREVLNHLGEDADDRGPPQ